MGTQHEQVKKRLRDWLFGMCVAWTLLQMVFGLTQYLHIGGFTVPSTMPAVAAIFLIAYCIRKEVDRWLQIAYEKKRGEYFFWMWSVFLLVLYVGEWITRGKYTVPGKSIEAMVYAGIVYVTTGVSRILSVWRHQNQKAMERRKPKGGVRPAGDGE